MSHHIIAVIGLGYVGLPLARLFATQYPTVGFDINQGRIAELNCGTDSTLEVSDELLQGILVSENSSVTNKLGLLCSHQIEDIADATIYIMKVPTPVDRNKRPDLTSLVKASETVGKVLAKATS